MKVTSLLKLRLLNSELISKVLYKRNDVAPAASHNNISADWLGYVCDCSITNSLISAFCLRRLFVFSDASRSNIQA